MSVITLVCPCGMTLKAPGAVPGRVGKCPRCGSLLKVPEAEARPEAEPEAPPDPPRPRRETFVGSRARRGPAAPGGRQQSDGLIMPPKHAETRLIDSMSYPLWNASSLALLAFMPPALVFTTMPLFMILPMVQAGLAVALVGVIWSIPQLLILLVVLGYVLHFLARVLTSSANGEVMVPRSPGWDFGEIGRSLARWFWALAIGGVIGLMPPLLYWIWCGEVDILDRIVLVDLIVPGMAYAQMALLSALVHDSPLAANPITVLRAILRVGWGYIVPCVFTGATMLVLGSVFAATLQIKDGLTQLVAYYMFWVAFLYMGMVMLRRLGLFCHRHSVVLEWFPDRSNRPG